MWASGVESNPLKAWGKVMALDRFDLQ